jgi:hypothetical protein
MSERLAKRIGQIEEKLNLRKTFHLDLVEEIHKIRMEEQRLLNLPPDQYLLELASSPKTRIERLARYAAADQKTFDNLSFEEKKRYLGYSHLSDEEFAKVKQAQDLKKKSPDNWVSRHLANLRSRPL